MEAIALSELDVQLPSKYCPLFESSSLAAISRALQDQHRRIIKKRKRLPAAAEAAAAGVGNGTRDGMGGDAGCMRRDAHQQAVQRHSELSEPKRQRHEGSQSAVAAPAAPAPAALAVQPPQSQSHLQACDAAAGVMAHHQPASAAATPQKQHKNGDGVQHEERRQQQEGAGGQARLSSGLAARPASATDPNRLYEHASALLHSSGLPAGIGAAGSEALQQLTARVEAGVQRGLAGLRHHALGGSAAPALASQRSMAAPQTAAASGIGDTAAAIHTAWPNAQRYHQQAMWDAVSSGFVAAAAAAAAGMIAAGDGAVHAAAGVPAGAGAVMYAHPLRYAAGFADAFGDEVSRLQRRGHGGGQDGASPEQLLQCIQCYADAALKTQRGSDFLWVQAMGV